MWISSGWLNYPHLAQTSHYASEPLCPLGRKCFLPWTQAIVKLPCVDQCFSAISFLPKFLLSSYGELFGRTSWREISNLTVTFSSRCLTFYPHLNIWKTHGNLSWKIKQNSVTKVPGLSTFLRKGIKTSGFLNTHLKPGSLIEGFGSAFISSALVNSAGKSVPLSPSLSPFSSSLYKVRDFQQSKWVKKKHKSRFCLSSYY